MSLANPFMIFLVFNNNFMRNLAIILGILFSCLLFSQNRSDVVDVVVDGKIETQKDKELQNYMLNYLRNFLYSEYEKENGFYLVVEQKTLNNQNSLKMDDLPFLSSLDIENIILKDKGKKYPKVIFKFNDKGVEKLKEITSNSIGNGIALIIDRKIITMLMISEKISTGQLEYNSTIPYNETETLINKLKK